MTKVLVLYYSSYGHIERMAEAVAEGAREAGAEAVVKRVPELVPEEVAQAAHYKLDQTPSVATVAELADYDAIVIGTPTRFGRMSSQMANFLDRPAASGRAVRSTARSAARSPRRRRSMAGRKPPCFRSSPTCCSSGWSWSASTTATPRKCGSTPSPGAHPTARRRSPAAMGRGSQATTS